VAPSFLKKHVKRNDGGIVETIVMIAACMRAPVSGIGPLLNSVWQKGVIPAPLW
jgi:cyanate permease